MKTRENTCVVCFALFTSYRKRRHCSDACRKREARGTLCACGHYESKHTGSENWPCVAGVGHGTCYCSEFRPAPRRSSPAVSA